MPVMWLLLSCYVADREGRLLAHVGDRVSQRRRQRRESFGISNLPECEGRLLADIG